MPNQNNYGNTNSNMIWNSYPQTCYNSNTQTTTPASMPPPPPPPPPPAYPTNDTTTYYQRQSNTINNVNSSNFPPPPPPSYPINGYGLPLQQQYQQPQHLQQQYSYYGVQVPELPYRPPPPPPPHLTTQSNQTKHQKRNKNNATIRNNKTPAATVSTTSNCIKPLEASKTFHCEPCSQTFQNNAAYQKHLSSHVRCKHYPNCTYTATPKKMKIHYQNSHGGKYAGRGLKQVIVQLPGSNVVQKFKICVGSHPDDVNKWIEQRKKKFPTREKVLMRKKKLEEKVKKRKQGYSDFVDAGEGDGDDKGDGSDRARSENNQEVNKKLKCSAEINVSKNEDKQQKQQAAQDPFGNLASYGSSSDDDDNVNDKSNGVADEKDTIDDNSKIPLNDTNNRTTQEGEKPNNEQISIPLKENVCNVATTSNSNSNFKTKQCRYFLKNGKCKNGDQCTYIHDIVAHEKYIAGASSRREAQSKRDLARNEAQREMTLLTGRGSGSGSNGTKRGGNEKVASSLSGQTLLRKLLQNDIRRERGLCLQLLRYIVDCNYLQEKRDRERKETIDATSKINEISQ